MPEHIDWIIGVRQSIDWVLEDIAVGDIDETNVFVQEDRTTVFTNEDGTPFRREN